MRSHYDYMRYSHIASHVSKNHILGSIDTKEDVVIRSCTHVSYEDWCMKVENKNGTATTCVCNTSLCNSATQQYLIKTFTVIVSIAWISYALLEL